MSQRSSEPGFDGDRPIDPHSSCILAVNVTPGSAVRRGQGLLVLEAMKMENTIMAFADGEVAKVHVASGELVAKGDLLVELNRE